MKRLKKVITVIIITTVITSLLGCTNNKTENSNNPTNQQTTESKLTITATFYPLAEFAKQIVKDKANVINILPPGAEDHGFEPTPQDIITIYNSKLLLLNGAGIDPWAEKIQSDLNSNGIKTLKMSDFFNVLDELPGGEEAEEDTTPGHDGDSVGKDPHFWLNPTMAKEEVEKISQTIETIDPANAAYYKQNATDYEQQLSQLDTDYQTALSNCQHHEIVTNHAAFGYLTEQYKLTQLPISGISPESEPSPQHLADLSKTIKEKNIKYIYFENLVSPKFAETLATEVGVKTLMLHHVGSLTPEELSANKNYISLMRDNLNNLKIGLECK